MNHSVSWVASCYGGAGRGGPGRRQLEQKTMIVIVPLAKRDHQCLARLYHLQPTSHRWAIYHHVTSRCTYHQLSLTVSDHQAV